jgi:predicted amino acid-binding ACT domain protein
MQTTAKDLAIDLGKDQAGMIAKAFEAIAKAKVNIDGFCETGQGVVHVLT